MTPTDLTVWSAPIVEKVFKTQANLSPKRLYSSRPTRNEMEAFQLILQSPTDQDLPVTLSDLVGEQGTIPPAG